MPILVVCDMTRGLFCGGLDWRRRVGLWQSGWWLAIRGRRDCGVCRPAAEHTGVSHGNKAERAITPHMYKCKACGCRHISHVPPLIKTVYDFADDATVRIKCATYVIERAACLWAWMHTCGWHCGKIRINSSGCL